MRIGNPSTRNGARRASARTAAWAALIPAALACGPTAAAVHDGGVGSCELCHVMHGAAEGQIAFDGSRPLLLSSSSTDLCLICHGQSGVFGANPLAPPRELGAGNFVWLLEDNLNDAPDGMSNRIGGEAAGHSIVSPARGVQADSRWTRAPGGTFPSSSLGCTSCHDPHGNGSFRMLHGPGPVQGGIGTFIHPAPVANGLAVTDGTAAESRTAHTAYQAGMTAWCANCHGFYHESGSAAFEHPVDEILSTGERRRYELYAGDLVPQGGSAATSYLPEVPFEEPTTTVDGTAGPGATARLHCLTCHRAHASSGPASGRWDFRVYRLADDGVVSGSWALPSPYPDPDQGQLCHKCHRQNHDRGQTCLSCHGSPEDPVFPASN